MTMRAFCSSDCPCSTRWRVAIACGCWLGLVAPAVGEIESTGFFLSGATTASGGLGVNQAGLASGLAANQILSGDYQIRSGAAATIENFPYFAADAISLVGDGGDLIEVSHEEFTALTFAIDPDGDPLVFTIAASSGELLLEGQAVDGVELASEESFSWQLPLSSVDPEPFLTVSAYDGVYFTQVSTQVNVASTTEAGFAVSTDSGTVETGSETDYGDVEVDAETVSETYTITNGTTSQANPRDRSGSIRLASMGRPGVALNQSVDDGDAEDLVISEIAIAGDHPDDFVISGIDLPLTLGPGESANFTVTFRPGHHGERQAEIEIFRQGSRDRLFGFGVRGRGNRPPTGGDDEIFRPLGLAPVKILIADLLANDSDIDGDTVEFGGFSTEISQNGRTLSLLNDEWILYFPGAADEDPDDSFVYRVSDGRGATAPSVVRIRDRTVDSVGANIEARLEVLPDGGVVLRVRAIPGRDYQAQYTQTLSGTGTVWTDLGVPVTASSENGGFSVVDGSPGTGSRFYRVVEVPEGN